MFAGMATGGAGAPLWAGIAAGAATGAVTNRKDPLMGAAMGGLGGYGGFGIGKSLFSAGAPSLGSGVAGGGSSGLATGGGYVPGATSAADIAYNSAMMGPTAGAVNTGLSNVGTSMMTDPSILNARNAAQAITSAGGGAGSPIANSAASAAEKTLSQYGSNLSQAKTGLGNIFSGDQAAIDAYTTGMGAKTPLGALGKTALPVGGALLGGLEPSDLYGEPINMDEAKRKQRYDPNARLNLGNDTGLRLVAKGGYIDGYATGGTIQSGGIRDLYGTPDNQPTISPGLSGFGLGRLNNLAGEQAMTQAQTLGYAEGGVASLELPDPSKTVSAPENLENMILNETAKTNMLENQLNNITSNALNTGNIPNQIYAPGALANVAAGMQNQPVPPQASFVQNLTSARTGYAEGGDVSNYRQDQAALNLDRLPSLNVNTGKQMPTGVQGFGDGNIGGLMGALMGRNPNVTYTTESGTVTPDEFRRTNVVSMILNGLYDKVGPKQMAKGGYLNGAGDGMSDSIPATIEGKQPARLADGEFVVPADVVSHLGNGSTKAGSKRLYAMLDKVRKARTGHTKQGKKINPAKYMPA
jgi:hypothetical protein